MADADLTSSPTSLPPKRAPRWIVPAVVLPVSALAGLIGLACALGPAVLGQAWINRRPASVWRIVAAIAAALTAGALAYGVIVLVVWLWRPELFTR